jgi:hypothetical protein
MHIRKRKCPNCKQFFTPRPSTRHHQRFCSARECQRSRKALNNRRFRRNNPEYDKGPHSVDRVLAWRTSNPGYWHREKRNGGPGRDLAFTLQAVQKSQVVGHQAITLQQKVDTLQAVSDRQSILFQ